MLKRKWAPYLMEAAARAGWGFSKLFAATVDRQRVVTAQAGRCCTHVELAEASVLLAAEQLSHKGVVPAVPDVLVELSVV